MKKFVVLFFLTAAVGAYAQQNSIDMVLIKGGTFTMGIPASGRRTFIGEGTVWPAHQVTVSDFYMGKYEVTYEMGSWRLGSRGNGRRDDIAKNPDNPTRNGWKTLPVHNVTWYDAIEFCNDLSEKEGLTPAYTINGGNVTWNRNANGYRLPTEAEWEYAARGGAESKGFMYAGSNVVSDVAWYTGTDSDKTVGVLHEGGKKQPNELCLYDMSGNVAEWCWDWAGDYPSTAQNNPAGPPTGTERIIRGGGWRGRHSFCVVLSRYSRDSSYSYRVDLGFRVARNAQ